MISLLTNVSSLNAQINLSGTQDAFDKSVQRLSSGMRIITASDDAAGLAISSQMTADVLSLQVAQRNANDAISLLQVADGGYEIINQLLTRMRELAVQAANVGTMSASDLIDLNAEFSSLLSEITRITNVTQYNGNNLLGTATPGYATAFQVGISNTANDQISFDIVAPTITGIGLTATTTVSTTAGATTAIGLLDTAIASIGTMRASLGAIESQVNSAMQTINNQLINLTAADSRIKDVDVASETAKFTNLQILMQAGVAVLSQANQEPSAAISLIKGA